MAALSSAPTLLAIAALFIARTARKRRNNAFRIFQQPRQIFFSLAVVRASSAMNGSMYAARDASLSTAAGFFIFGGDAAS